jgi:hypothetical protein
MKYAVSLARQGELIDATAADYDSFRQQLLNCPHCRSSVYLVKAHSRVAVERKLRSGKTTSVDPCEIPAFFSHHQQEEWIECELYNRTLTSASVAKSVAVARNQRLEIFRNRFVDIFLTASAIGMFEGETAAKTRKSIANIRKSGGFFSTIPATLFAPITPIPFPTKLVEPAIDHCLKFPYRDWGRERLIGEVLPSLLIDDIPPKDRIGDDKTQLEYTVEALDFLYTPTQRKLLTEILWILAFEIAGSVCWGTGQEIMSSAKDMGFSSDRQARLAKLPEFLQESLTSALTDPLYRYAVKEGYVSRSGKDLSRGADSGIRLPLKLLMTCLLTIDWVKEFGCKANDY